MIWVIVTSAKLTEHALQMYTLSGIQVFPSIEKIRQAFIEHLVHA